MLQMIMEWPSLREDKITPNITYPIVCAWHKGNTPYLYAMHLTFMVHGMYLHR